MVTILFVCAILKRHSVMRATLQLASCRAGLVKTAGLVKRAGYRLSSRPEQRRPASCQGRALGAPT
jgi:hypothetical protein